MKIAFSRWKRGGWLSLPAAMLIALLVRANSRAGQAHDAADIWQKSLTIGVETPMRADMTLVQRVPGKTLTSQAHVLQGMDGKYRVEYTAPAEAQGRIVTSDGPRFRQFDPKQNTETILAQVAGTGQGGRKTDPLIPGSHKITLLSDHETIAGRMTYLLEITPLRADLSHQRRWIDRVTFKTLRVETRFPDGKLSRDVAYRPIQLPARVTPSDFQIPKHPGIHVIDASRSAVGLSPQTMSATALSLGLLTSAPLGFRLMQTTEGTIGGKHHWQFLYSNGIETLSIFAQDGGPTPKIAPAGWQRLVLQGVPIFAQQTGHTNALVWSRGGHRYTAMSRMASDALQAFVAGLMH